MSDSPRRGKHPRPNLMIVGRQVTIPQPAEVRPSTEVKVASQGTKVPRTPHLALLDPATVRELSEGTVPRQETTLTRRSPTREHIQPSGRNDHGGPRDIRSGFLAFARRP